MEDYGGRGLIYVYMPGEFPMKVYENKINNKERKKEKIIQEHQTKKEANQNHRYTILIQMKERKRIKQKKEWNRKANRENRS